MELRWVSYPGLTSHPYHANALKYFRKGYGGTMLSFGVKGGDKDLTLGGKIVDALVLCSNLANVGDCKTVSILICRYLFHKTEELIFTLLFYLASNFPWLSPFSFNGLISIH